MSWLLEVKSQDYNMYQCLSFFFAWNVSLSFATLKHLLPIKKQNKTKKQEKVQLGL